MPRFVNFSTSGHSESWNTALENIAAEMPEFSGVAPENDLRPDAAKLAFELRLLAGKVERLTTLFRKMWGL